MAPTTTSHITPATPISSVKYPVTPLDDIMPRCYIRVLFAYPKVNIGELETRLKSSLPPVLNQFPHLAGIISCDDQGHQTVSVTNEGSAQFVSKSLDQEFDSLKSMSSFDNDTFSPVPPVPVLLADGTCAVFAVQLTALKGGAILCVAVHHAVCDGPGMGIIVSTWASYSRTGEMPKMPDGYLDRSALLRYNPDVEEFDIPEYYFDTGGPRNRLIHSNPVGSAPYASHLFKIRVDKICDVQKVLPSEEGFVSKNDVLTALVWRSITSARKEAGVLLSPDEGEDATSVIGMATNGRLRLTPPLPKEYFGNVNFFTPTILPISALIAPANLSSPSPHLPLLNVAKAIRTAVNSMKGDRLDAALRFLSIPPQIDSPKQVMPGFNGYGRDYGITSWAAMFDDLTADTDFGGESGGATYARNPDAQFDGLAMIFPKPKQETVFDVFIGLRTEAMAALEKNAEWQSFLA